MIKNFDELNAKINECTEKFASKLEGKNAKRSMVLCGGTGCISSNSLEIKAKIEEVISGLESI